MSAVAINPRARMKAPSRAEPAAQSLAHALEGSLFDADDGACAATRAWFRAMEADAILRGQLQRLNSAALYGAAVLTKIAEDHLEKIGSQSQPWRAEPRNPSAEEFELASRYLNEAQAVLNVIYDNGLDDPCLSGVIALLSMAMGHTQEAIGEAMAREQAE